MTVSIGVSSFPGDGYTAEALLKKADDNLYSAKENGRDRVWPGSL
ncbi:MAG: diguanylate cyclase [Candidatus Omnitrophota bacterium]